jgi:phage terminase small subunit
VKRTARKSDDRMEVFARQYVALQFNGKQAAILAGYSKRTAESQASRLLRNVKVKGLIAKFSAPLNKKLDFSVENVLNQIAKHAMVDPQALFNPDGSWKKITELAADVAACISTVEQTGSRPKRVKLTDSLRALDMLARYHKLFAEDRTPIDLGVKVIVLDMPRPMRQVGSGAAALPPSNGHKNGNSDGHE